MKRGMHFQERKRRFSFDKKEVLMNKFDIQRILSVRKMNREEKNYKDISKEIGDYFSSPEKYFEKNSPVTIGKKIYLIDMNDPKLRRGKKLKTEKKMAKNLFNNLVNYNNALSIRQNNDSNIINKSIMSNYKKGKDLDMSSKFEIIDNNRLKMIFNSYKNRPKKDKSFFNDKSNASSFSDSYKTKVGEKNGFKNQIRFKNANSSMDNMPYELKNSLFMQNRKLALQKLTEKQNIRMSRYLSKKIKKPQNNLLLNRIDSFRFKKEIINEMENSKPIDEQYGKYKWNISLRRPDNFKGVRDSYINLKGERFMPFWSLVIEKCPKQKELILRPGHSLYENEIKEFQKKSNSNSRYKNEYFKTVENLEDLSVEGKNLYNLEYKREIIDSKNNKILHKVFVENGKAISLTDINNLYGNNTFYKDYIYCRTEKSTINNINNFRDK